VSHLFSEYYMSKQELKSNTSKYLPPELRLTLVHLF